jgi:hypothetical protein
MIFVDEHLRHVKIKSSNNIMEVKCIYHKIDFLSTTIDKNGIKKFF